MSLRAKKLTREPRRSSKSYVRSQKVRRALRYKSNPASTSLFSLSVAGSTIVELEKLKDEFPHLRNDILIKRADANEYIIELCTKRSWADRRAVMFLDPYGMQVSWQTITAIASTKGIDLWLLFPLGIGVNRLMQRDGKIPPARRRLLDAMFGTTDWFESFYRQKQERGLFDDSIGLEKVANFDSIAEFFVERLKTVFPHVSKSPIQLLNSSRNPLYLLCFAAANEKGGKIAVSIADHILRKK